MFQAFSDISRVAGEVWFVVLPPMLFFIFKLLWMGHVQNDYIESIRNVLLEIIPPRDVEKSPKVMETFFDGLSGSDKTPSTIEQYIQGYLPPLFSLEFAGGGGEAHMYIRTPVAFRNLVEAYLYAQYPGIEIVETESDYVDSVPKGAPNKEWDLWGADFEFVKPDPYPIKTYHAFEEDVTGKMIDPLAGIFETLGKLPPGQQVWLQYIIAPQGQTPYNTGRELLQELIGRVSKVKPVSALGKAWTDLGDIVKNIPNAATGTPLEFSAAAEEKAENGDFNEFRLTPVEKKVIEALESNIGRNVFATKMRMVYIGKKKGFNRAVISSVVGGIKQFNDSNLNAFKPNDVTKTYANYAFSEPRLRYRQRRILRRYKLRDPDPDFTMMMLSTAELATIFHVPDMAVVAPSLTRITAKRSVAPSNLPIQ